MDRHIRKVVIAGAGQAGATAAAELRRAGFDGDIALVGAEPHAPYERPQLSKEWLGPGGVALRSMRPAESYERDGIRLMLGRRVDRVDAAARCVRLDDGADLDYDRLLIATGVRPRRPPPPLSEHERVRYLRCVEDAAALREQLQAGRSLAVVGGGVLNLEVAAAASARGVQVTVIEAADRLMARSVDARVSAFLDRTHRARGVDIRYGVQAAALEPGGLLRLTDGTCTPADTVLVSIGVTPNVEAVAHLGLADAAGVRVDACGRTTIEEIYAAGDVAAQPGGRGHARVETWANAQDQSIAAARSLLGEATPYRSPAWFWSDQGPTNLQVVGEAVSGRSVARGEPSGDLFSLFWLDAADRLTGCATINAPKDMAMARRWIRQGARLDAQRLGDLGVPLRDCCAA
jgi:p-cumate 2,3-dioxygenase ferredoxin reductase subunit